MPPKRKGKAKAKKIKPKVKKPTAEELMKEKLNKEIQLGKLNAKRHEDIWRQMVERIKIPIMKENVEIASNVFKRALDVKDYRIARLMDSLNEAEQQYQRNQSSHIEVIDRLLKFYEVRISNEKSTYQSNVDDIVNEMNIEAGRIDQEGDIQQSLLDTIVSSMTLKIKESLDNAKSNALSRVDTFNTENENLRTMTETHIEQRIEALGDHIQQIINNYQNDNKKRFKEYKILSDKDERDQEIMKNQSNRITNLFDNIHKVRKNYMDLMVKKKEIKSDIMIEHDFFLDLYWGMKNRLKSEEEIDKTRLTVLSNESNRTVNDFKSLLKKSDRVLTLLEACNKYGFEGEKIFPPFFRLRREEEFETTSNKSISFDWEITRAIMEDYQDMDLFWRRLAAIQMTIEQLKIEKDHLKLNTDDLRQRLKYFISKEYK